MLLKIFVTRLACKFAKFVILRVEWLFFVFTDKTTYFTDKAILNYIIEHYILSMSILMYNNTYYRVCEDTNQEILKIERQQRQANRKIEKLQKQLLQCKNSMEVKIMSERILDRQVSLILTSLLNFGDG